MHRLRLLTVLFTWLLLTVGAAAKTVVIDAGHGGHDRGGMPRQRIPEKGYALDVAQRLQRILSAAGYKTVMTRNGDYFVSLGGRVSVANSAGSCIFVSIHFNGAPRSGANGIETYYYSSRSSKLASAIHSQVVATAGTENRGVRKRGFYVLRNTRPPAVLCELGFLTNPSEGKKISTSSSYRQSLAEAVARGVMRAY
jgi:N-acetylmuramoyl-L-alanine amidase